MIGKSNCLFVLNGNNVMTDNARRSIAAAAVRWNCDYWEYRTGPLAPEYFHSYHRYLAMAQPHPWGRILAIDPDMLIHHLAPSPFAAFPDTQLVYGVQDCQAVRHPADRRRHVWEQVHRVWLGHVSAALQQRVDVEKYFTHMFSAAFLLLSFPEHQRVVETVRDWLPKVYRHRTNGHFEQALFNVALDHTETPTRCVDETWNMISPPSGIRMQGHIYHFTGLDSGYQRTRIATFNWWS